MNQNINNANSSEQGAKQRSGVVRVIARHPWWFGFGLVLVILIVRTLVQGLTPSIPIAEFQARAEEFGEQVLALIDPDMPRSADDFVSSRAWSADGRIEHGWTTWEWRVTMRPSQGESVEALSEPIIDMLLENGWSGYITIGPEERFIRREFALDDLGGYWWITMYTNVAPRVLVIIRSPRF